MKKKMKTKVLLGITLVNASIIFSLLVFNNSNEGEQNLAEDSFHEKNIKNQKENKMKKDDNSRDVASIPSPDKTASQGNQSKSLDAIYREKYHNGPEANALADKTDEIFKNSKFKEQIKKWNVLGLYFTSSEDYVELMNENIEILKENSQEIMDDVLAVQDQVEKDPFMEQMILSMVYTLDVSADRKADYSGKILSRQISFEGEEVNESSLNVNSAFAYMKQSGVSDAVASDYIAKGLEQNSADEKSYEAFLLRAQAYYPDLVQE